MPRPEGKGAEATVGIWATGWTDLKQTLRMNSPIRRVQFLNFLNAGKVTDAFSSRRRTWKDSSAMQCGNLSKPDTGRSDDRQPAGEVHFEHFV
jgi:hypothetical protein